MKTPNKIFAALFITALAALASCKKDNAPSGYMAASMTEARTSGSAASPENPGLTSVNIDIRSVEVHLENEAEGNAGWIELKTRAGIYDLLKLQNDVTAVLAEDTKLPVGHITQIRLILGGNNSVIIGGVNEQDLTVPSGDNSGLKINVNTTVKEDKHLLITLLFDADNSIVFEGNGGYKLSPVIKVKSITEY